MLNYSSSFFSIHVVYVVFLLRANLQNTQSQLCKTMCNPLGLNIRRDHFYLTLRFMR